jgi:hypothetical protein
MPRKAIDYSKCLIYKLCCDDPLIIDVYVGHTTDKIRRNWQHKHSCNNQNAKTYNYYVYQFIRENGGWDNWSMIIVEEYPCENKNQAEARERYWIETQQATLNKYIPTRTREERYEENKEEISEYQKQYREEHKEEMLEYKKQYYEEHKDDILKYNKKYREQHKEEIKEINKRYREEHEEEIKEKKSQKFDCECGGKYDYSHKNRHLKSKKHLKYLN